MPPAGAGGRGIATARETLTRGIEQHIEYKGNTFGGGCQEGEVFLSFYRGGAPAHGTGWRAGRAGLTGRAGLIGLAVAMPLHTGRDGWVVLLFWLESVGFGEFYVYLQV